MWNEEFTKKILVEHGFVQSIPDNFLFTKTTDLAFNVLHITETLAEAVRTIMDSCINNVPSKDIGNANYFLGLEISHTKSALVLS